MPTLITTPAAVDANSYASVAEADAYHTGRLNNAEWTAAVQGTKETALIMATRMLDELAWEGTPFTVTQALRWPRYGIYNRDMQLLDPQTIPQRLKEAASELAFLLIKEDTSVEPDSTGMSSMAVGSITLNYDKTDRKPRISAGVMAMIAQWLRARGARLQRV